MDAPHLRPQHPVPPQPGRGQGRIGALRDASVVGGRGDRQDPADRLDPILTPMIVDERDHGFDRRSSSARAKYADAFRRISLAWRSSRFSRSRALCDPALRSSDLSACRGPARPALPSAAASPPCSRSSPRSSQLPPTASRDPRRRPAPAAPPAPEPQASGSPPSSSPSSLPSSQQLEPPANPALCSFSIR
jgi:hypothetical protein